MADSIMDGSRVFDSIMDELKKDLGTPAVFFCIKESHDSVEIIIRRVSSLGFL